MCFLCPTVRGGVESLARTQFAGNKNQVAEWFSFGACDHDGGFSFPAALGGAEAYLFRWRGWLVTRTFLDVQVIIDNHCSVALSRGILSSGGIVAYVVLDYVSRTVYILYIATDSTNFH